MTLRVQTASGRDVHFAACTLNRGIEQAMSVLQLQTHDVLLADLGQEIQVTWHGKRVFTGTLEDLDGNPLIGFSLGFRSRVVNLDKFDATGNEYFAAKNTVRAIVAVVAGRAGVVIGSVPHVPVNKFRIKRGTNYRKALQELAETYQLVVSDDALGRLVLFGLDPSTRPAPATTWAQGQAPTVGPITAQLDISDLRAEYVCRGQRALVDGDFDADNEEEIGETLAGAALPASRKVLPNKAASSRADAVRLLDWTAKQAVARAIQIKVPINEYPGDPGFAVRVRADVKLPGESSRFVIDEPLIASGVMADFVARRFEVTCMLPEVYIRKQRMRTARYTAATSWQKRGRAR